MKTKKNLIINILLLVAAVGMLAYASIGGVQAIRAALTPGTSYLSGMQLQNLSVQIVEDEKVVEGDELVMTDLAKDPAIIPGKNYKEELTVKNDGDMDAYVRLVVYKYWENEKGEKRTDLDPALIKLQLDDENWIVDEKASTPERTVLYYAEAVPAGETIETPAVTGFSVDGKIIQAVTESRETTEKDGKKYTTITHTYAYDGLSIGITAEADAVQTHNIENAAMSAWGISASAMGLK